MAKPGKKKAAKKTAKKKAVKKAGKKVTVSRKSKNPPGMHTAHEVVHERRFETRTLASKMTYASVSLGTGEFARPGYSFKPDISALLVDTSEGGCSLVFMRSNPLSGKVTLGARCVVQVTPASPRLATVRWLKDLDGRLLNAGFQYET